MLNLAIASVARDLGATVSDVQWIVNGYYVALVSVVLVAGSVGDIVGHRRVFRAGLLLFAAGALACAAAPTVPLLVAGRVLQGIGAALLLTAGLALVTRLTPPGERDRAIGLFLGLVAAVPALGPFVSGTLVDLLSWRWLFVVPLVLPIGAFLVTWLRVPETPRADGRRPDLAGAAVGFVMLAAFSVAAITGVSGASESPGALPAVALAIAVVAAIAFVAVERRVVDPMLPLRFFRNRVFLGGNLIWLLGCLTSWGAVFFVAVTLQVTLGLRPFVAGLVLTPIYLVMMVGSPLAGRLAARLGSRRPIVAGLAVYAVGLLLLSRIGASSAVGLDVLPAIVVFALGMAVFSAPLGTATMGALGDEDQGLASGMNNAMGQLAGLLAMIVLPAVAGLGGASLDGPAFAVGYPIALQFAAGLALVGVALAVVTFRPVGGQVHPMPTPAEPTFEPYRP